MQRLHADYPRTKAGNLYRLFGGAANLAEDLAVDLAVLSRWNSKGKRGHHGRVPTRYNPQIMDAAARRGLDLKKVQACLEPNTCPCCGHPLEPGAIIDPRHYRVATGK